MPSVMEPPIKPTVISSPASAFFMTFIILDVSPKVIKLLFTIYSLSSSEETSAEGAGAVGYSEEVSGGSVFSPPPSALSVVSEPLSVLSAVPSVTCVEVSLTASSVLLEQPLDAKREKARRKAIIFFIIGYPF